MNRALSFAWGAMLASSLAACGSADADADATPAPKPDAAVLQETDAGSAPDSSLRPDAASTAADAGLTAPRAENQHRLRVLLLALDPVEGGKRLSEVFFPKAELSASQVEDEIARIASESFAKLSQGRIQFELVHKAHIQTFPPYSNGFQYDFDKFSGCTQSPPSPFCETQKWLADYPTWLKQNQVCELASQHQADEIWVVSSPYLLTWENFMIGPTTGFDVNGGRYVVEGCDRHYVVMNPTYERLDTVMHNYGHRVERTMMYLTQSWSTADRQRYWENFARLSRYDSVPLQAHEPRCGNAHFAPNSEGGYDYGNPTPALSNCAGWALFPEPAGSPTPLGCEAWGCSDNGWNSYWLGALPHSEGEATLTDQAGQALSFPRDWWRLLLFPDAAIQQARH